MKPGSKAIDCALRLSALLIYAVVALTTLAPLAACARAEAKTVRVGWYESPFNITDRHGRRSGYAYEYQRKIAAYTGWRYEYIEGSWPDLMQMLVDGEIDLMSDVSYTPERAEAMLFPDLPMGAEEYYLFIDRDNKEIDPADFSTLNGKKVGASKGSVQISFYNDWAGAHGIQSEIVELSNSEEESRAMLHSGELDAYLNLDSYADPATVIPVSMIGASDFYFAVNRDRPDLLDELNVAMTRLRSEDRFYNEEMYEKYNSISHANMSLSGGEADWLETHGPIRVGYQDNYMAFCDEDENGELSGALKDYLA